ncbi:MAG: hypothetical protein GXO68_03960 [Crenarchaeota archaeon]|nr:hypothetical protein [Thermoproteota archaeon]
MESVQGFLRDILSRRDPHGYYVIPVDVDRVDDVLRSVKGEGVKVLYANDIALVKTRSRGLAVRIARVAARMEALVTEF